MVSDGRYHIKPSKEGGQRINCSKEKEQSRIHNYYLRNIAVDPESGTQAQASHMYSKKKKKKKSLFFIKGVLCTTFV